MAQPGSKGLKRGAGKESRTAEGSRMDKTIGRAQPYLAQILPMALLERVLLHRGQRLLMQELLRVILQAILQPMQMLQAWRAVLAIQPVVVAARQVLPQAVALR